MHNIIIIEPSSSGLELLTTAKKMGLITYVFNANKDERIIPHIYRKHIDHLIQIDTYDLSSLLILTKKINLTNKISAIIPGSEYHVPIAAQLSSMLNLPGVSPKSVDGLRTKSKMRKYLALHDVRCPRNAEIANENEIVRASEYVKFPCVIKPIESAGSIHVSKANNLHDLYQAYNRMRTDTWTELGKGIGSIALIEEYINGEEFSVEGYINGANPEIVSITKKFLTPEPLFIEMGHIVPANINDEKQRLITSYIQSVISALNVNAGIFHAELKIDENGPVLIEIAGRLPGCRIPELIQLAKGINFYQIMIQSHLGLPIKSEPTQYSQYAGMCYFKLDGKETFNTVNNIDKLSSMVGFHEFKLLKQPGEFVPPLTTFSGRVAMCIFTAPTYHELITRLHTAKSIVSFS